MCAVRSNHMDDPWDSSELPAASEQIEDAVPQQTGNAIRNNKVIIGGA